MLNIIIINFAILDKGQKRGGGRVGGPREGKTLISFLWIKYPFFKGTLT